MWDATGSPRRSHGVPMDWLHSAPITMSHCTTQWYVISIAADEPPPVSNSFIFDSEIYNKHRILLGEESSPLFKATPLE